WRSFVRGGPLMKEWMTRWGALAFLSFGAMFGLIFFPILVTLTDEMISNIKALFSKSPLDVEKREPLRYRYTLLIYLALLVISVAFWYYASMGNLPILFGLYWYVVLGLYLICRARVAAEFGIVYDPLNDNVFAHSWDVNFREWWVADPYSPCFIRDLQARFLVLRGDYSWFSTFIRAAPVATLLQSFKIGSLQMVSSKHILLAAVISTVTSVIVSLFTLLPMWCHFGALNLSAFNFTGAPNNYQQRGPTYAAITEVGDYWRGGIGIVGPTANQWILFAVGVAIVSVVHVLHARYPWFPLNPAGVALGFGWLIAFLIVPSIVAYVAKIVILKMGGEKLYEEKAIPFAIGIMISIGLATILGIEKQIAAAFAA
ncbi:MAG: DUF6785 family protein, partial [Candidatus Bathyarchaeia archaeon]